MNIDTDKLVEILKKDKPLSVMVVEDNGKDKLVCLFALPELAKDIEAFGKAILDDKPTYEELVDALYYFRENNMLSIAGLEIAVELLERIKS